MKIKIILTFCCAALFLASCTHVFYPAMYHQDISYMPAPTSVDSAKTATYVSGGLGVGSDGGFNDTQISAQLNVSRGYNLKNFALAYGFFGVAGDHSNDNINKGQPYYFTDKFYGALGGRVAASFVIATPTIDIRPIGFEAAYSHETGAYAGFRNNLNSNPPDGYYIEPRTNLFTLGLTSEVIFHKYAGGNLQHGVNFFLGAETGHNVLDGTYYDGEEDTFSNQLFRNLYFKAGYFIKYKNFFAIAEASVTHGDIKMGVAF